MILFVIAKLYNIFHLDKYTLHFVYKKRLFGENRFKKAHLEDKGIAYLAAITTGENQIQQIQQKGNPPTILPNQL